jgi:hypothetical protein
MTIDFVRVGWLRRAVPMPAMPLTKMCRRILRRTIVPDRGMPAASCSARRETVPDRSQRLQSADIEPLVGGGATTTTVQARRRAKEEHWVLHAAVPR